METGMIEAAAHALVTILDPFRMLLLGAGVIMGLVLGILPGIGGLSGMAMLLPFTFSMDPYAAFAFLLGLGSVTATGDPIPAILFGVPGGAGSQATVLDGLPMARRGEAGRALSAAYMSSMIGGVVGAAILAVAIPILRPAILLIGSPEMLALAIFGISMVAVLSGSAPLRGLVAACFGLMLSMIGTDPQGATPRWTGGSLFLMDGLPLLPLVLGIFALPELCDLAIRRMVPVGEAKFDTRAGMVAGARDCFRHWFLTVRCSALGAVLGAIPGISAAVLDWLAYGHALRTEPNARKTFGKGDVRGVIASESANNAKEGGALIPTIAFGVPGSASMAILLGAFLIHGLVPGPEMLTKHLDVTYTLIWSIALANILGAGLCYLFSGQFARLALLRFTLILPCILVVIYVGAFEGERDWGSLYALLLFGVLGWTMKQMKWPRPPLVLGFVLGDLLERYLFISTEIYGAAFLLRPLVAMIILAALFGLLRPLYQDIRRQGGIGCIMETFERPRLHPEDGFPFGFLVVIGVMVAIATGWPFEARFAPMVVGTVGFGLCCLSLANQVLRRSTVTTAPARGGLRAEEPDEDIHMDLSADHAALPAPTVIGRAARFFGWLVGLILCSYLIGFLPTVPLFIILFMRLEGPEAWRLVVPQAVGATLFVYFVFDRILTIPWPPSLIGRLLPALKFIPTV